MKLHIIYICNYIIPRLALSRQDGWSLDFVQRSLTLDIVLQRAYLLVLLYGSGVIENLKMTPWSFSTFLKILTLTKIWHFFLWLIGFRVSRPHTSYSAPDWPCIRIYTVPLVDLIQVTVLLTCWVVGNWTDKAFWMKGKMSSSNQERSSVTCNSFKVEKLDCVLKSIQNNDQHDAVVYSETWCLACHFSFY